MMGKNEDTTRNRKKTPKRMPWVIPSCCEGCGDCVHRCPPQGLVMIETNVEGIYVPWLIEPEKCTGCGKCGEGCVMGGIVMTEYVEKAMVRFLENKPEVAK